MLANKLTLRSAVAALALAFGSTAALADTTLAVTIDTSLFGDAGWIDFQYNPASLGMPPATTVTLSGFHGFDAGAAVETAGQVSGSLATGYVIGNGEAFNSLLHAVNFGSVLSFNVTFSGDNVDPSGNGYGSDFAVYAYNAGLTTDLGNSTDPGKRLVGAAWTPETGSSGTLLYQSYSSVATISAVPEPGSWLMLGIGALLVAGAVRRRA
jgi:PEP-CTERM motif